MDDWKQRQAVERMRSDLHYMENYRKRASALDSLGGLLDCETPGTVSEVGVKRGRWQFWHLGGDKTDAREIVLTDAERREFSAWCKERALKLRADADKLELGYADREV
jgi:hypothetical protein